ncbi:jg23530, partial [Pararge aegeria aegeria]
RENEEKKIDALLFILDYSGTHSGPTSPILEDLSITETFILHCTGLYSDIPIHTYTDCSCPRKNRGQQIMRKIALEMGKERLLREKSGDG